MYTRTRIFLILAEVEGIIQNAFMTPRKFLELPTTFSFSLLCFFFIWVFITAFDPDFTIDLAHKKTQVLDPLLALTCVLLLLGRYKCYTCSGGGRTGDIGRRLTPFCYHKGFNSQLPRKKCDASKPESVSRVSLQIIFMDFYELDF